MTMQENQKTRDTIQGGYTKRGMFLTIWLYSQCWPLKESFSIVIFLKLVTKLSIVGVDYKDFEGSKKQRYDRERIKEDKWYHLKIQKDFPL